MNSTNTNYTYSQSNERFSKCDSIEKFYESRNVTTTKTTGLFGGKSFTWFVSEKGQSFRVFCDCTAPIGLGYLSIKSRMASDLSIIKYFKNPSDVNPTNSKIQLTSPLGFETSEIRLPTPDSITKPENDNIYGL
jgi:hypothetical protein